MATLLDYETKAGEGVSARVYISWSSDIYNLAGQAQPSTFTSLRPPSSLSCLCKDVFSVWNALTVTSARNVNEVLVFTLAGLYIHFPYAPIWVCNRIC